MDPAGDTAVTPAPSGRSVPRRIGPDNHPITLEMIDRDALHIMRKLNSAGFSAYLVGGGVRDLYLGKQPKDFDISTNARPGQIRKLFPNSTTIGRRFRLVQVYFKNSKIIEVSTLRSLSEHDIDGPEEVLAPNNTYGSLDEDALRRDLTINSLFYDPECQCVIDYVQGVSDLDNSTIRIVGEPQKRVTRDPVRMLRAIRHAARNNFTIEARSWQAICENHHNITLCPSSRLRDEVLKDLYSGAATSWFELAVSSGLFLELFPLYREILYQADSSGATCHTRLSQLMALIDRLNTRAVAQGISRQPDFFLFALLLIPWADIRFDLLSRKRRGPELFHTSRHLRIELDTQLGVHLNLRKSLRQEITTLLTNLSTLIHQRTNDSWPKWLKKKSYFKRCSLFYFCHLEAMGGNPVSDEQLGIMQSEHKTHNKPHRNKGSRRQGGPAFSPRAKRGIFGFKK